MYDPHATSSTFSATVTQYGSYQQALDGSPSLTGGFGPSAIVTQPTAPITLPYTQTWTGTDGGPWPPEWSTDGGTATIQGNAGRLTSPASPYATTFAYLSGLAVADVEVLVDFTAVTAGVEQYPQVALRSDSAHNGSRPTNGYSFFMCYAATTSSGLVQIERQVNNSSTVLGTPAFAFVGGVTYRARCRVLGAVVSVKVWDASGAEPGTWTWTTTDATPYLTAGSVYLAQGTGNVSVARSADFDNLTVASAVTNATATGTVTLGGSGTVSTTVTTSGVITLGGSSTPAATATSAGGIGLGGSASPAATVAASGSITLGGTSTARAAATASGAITLSGTAMAQAVASTTGTIGLSGTATAQATTTTTGSITLAGTSAATAPATATGSVVLGGATTPRATTTAAGTVTVAGTASSGAAPVPATASGGVTLGGSSTARAGGAVVGAVTLAGGTTTTTAGGSSSTSGITLGGTSSGSAPVTGGGVIVLGGAITVAIPASVDGAIQLNGLANAIAAPLYTPTYAGPNQTLIVAAENRTVVVGPETGLLTVSPENRTYAVPAEDRVTAPAADTRVLTVT